jgi:hypothetical protein
MHRLNQPDDPVYRRSGDIQNLSDRSGVDADVSLDPGVHRGRGLRDRSGIRPGAGNGKEDRDAYEDRSA